MPIERTVHRRLASGDVLLVRSDPVGLRRKSIRRHVTISAAEVDCSRQAIDFPWRQDFVLVFQQHVVDWRQTDTGAQHVVDARPLAEERVDQWRTLRH